MSFNREKENNKRAAHLKWAYPFRFSYSERKRRPAMKKESDFQKNLKKELKKLFPGCFITKLDSGDIQGIPDLLILYKDKWATLENKRKAMNIKFDFVGT